MDGPRRCLGAGRGRRAGKTVEPGVKRDPVIDDPIADADRFGTVPL
jgi:hypothetical protein